MRATRHLPAKYDILLAADFMRRGDIAFRLAHEIRGYAERQLKVGLVQARAPTPRDEVASEITTCLRRRWAETVSVDRRVDADTLVMHGPADADPAALPIVGRSLREVVFVAYSPPDIEAAVGFPVASRLRKRIHATSADLRAGSTGLVEIDDWLPLLPTIAFPVPSAPGHVPAVGWIASSGLDSGDLAACAGIKAEHHAWPGAGEGQGFWPLPDLSLDRLIAGLDVMVVAPEARDDHALPDTMIASMLQSGRCVLMTRRLKAKYGSGPTYFGTEGLYRPLARALAKVSAVRTTALRRQPTFVARCRKGPAELLAPRISAGAFCHAANVQTRQRPLLFLAANGVGVGHLTRLLAVARRAPGPVVFATHAPAVGILQDFGFPVEYIPSAAAVGGEFDSWDGWFKAHLDHLLDAWDPSVVAYDGNHLSRGLIEAVGARRDCRLAWVRRGMWGKTTSVHMPNVRWCDLVIEPGELAAVVDAGITARRRAEALQVDPVVLLDAEELLNRAQASAALGLNAARPAVLIQLGSGYNRDLLTLLDQIIPVLSAVPGLQIAVAEWVNGSVPLTLWPQVKVLRGFPLSQYIRAFDFCISAAGYNAYHELISFGVPTIFIANRHPTMDDQYGRAKFAQDHAAAFELSENDLGDLPALVGLMLQDSAQRYLSNRCAALTRPNGAAEAARALSDLAARSLQLIG
jgi:hypothetical protein